MTAPLPDSDRIAEPSARRIVVGGRVQGVGFRPFVYRTATALGLSGWVRNGAGRVLIHVEGPARALARFEAALNEEAPPFAEPHLERAEDTAAEGADRFTIVASETGDDADIHVPPDMFCCEACRVEIADPRERRHRYPFTNCTQCGPRYTIIEALPYDRPNTAMAGFVLCVACGGEYEDPRDRRFHAQPLGCPDCGPRLTFRRDGDASFTGGDALAAAVAHLRGGGIVATKGIGGYHLMCDAASDEAVKALRARKHRPHKPLAVMVPNVGADGLDAARAHVALDDAEARACADPRRPIVLARRRAGSGLSAALAPGLAELGVFLPYSPLHHLLLSDFAAPLVATSGNVSGEPVLTDDAEAEARLRGVATAFLHHDRPIVRPADDSVVRVITGKPRPVRLGRGLAPLEIDLPRAFAEPTLAVGGQMKGAVALGWGRRAVVSPHIGELDSPRSRRVFEQVVADLQALYRVEARRVVCDAHPGYAATRWARDSGLPLMRVQHHAAHASALAGEAPQIDRWLVFAWDGIGLGTDGRDRDELWGGEALLGAPGCWRRVASMRPFRLTGGDRAGREPWRSAAAVMWEAGHAFAPAVDGAGLAAQAWCKGVGTARTSSVGRLFDAAAALILGVDVATFEGQGPMLLESAADATDATGEAVPLPLARDPDGLWRSDWAPLLPVIADATLSAGARAALFHESMARALVDQVTTLARTEDFRAVGLTGGVFQNRLLADRVCALLAAEGITARLPEAVPANDGGLAFGQLVEALYRGARGGDGRDNDTRGNGQA
ncbi:carbamoyltransferase HypF [Microbaculum marinisediminis]|uniref:Carbamoyltransferase HypF n=1 Tax=Microbaculum marinisediminis TaxID=2931392 RepID=A0AAW5R283_9HYPH|nr:carbamoyltransferase HypF [Microbaculum sp. A6E488]MCT8973477.1 carbamoyltransferase HypF [Microbaculum sp. A6E488]